MEHHSSWWSVSSIISAPTIWKETFYQTFGENAVLPSRANGKAHEVDNFARVMGYKVMPVEQNLGHVLETCGVKRADTIQADEYAELLSGENTLLKTFVNELQKHR